ncbi:MAG: YgjV family protein [Clostridia bacterium]|nr:YgjV family protein [Clostridia bacterium]
MSYILSGIGLAVLIVASLIKGETIKKTLYLVLAGNLLVATSYLFTDNGVNGAISSYIGSIQALINIFYTKKNKNVPVWLLVVYALSFIVANIAVLKDAVGIIALLATLCFVGCVSSKTGKGYRVWQAANNLLWILYDVLSYSYGPLVTHTVLCLFTVAGILWNDCRKTKKEIA